jgi:hypothetical protein
LPLIPFRIFFSLSERISLPVFPLSLSNLFFTGLTTALAPVLAATPTP